MVQAEGFQVWILTSELFFGSQIAETRPNKSPLRPGRGTGDLQFHLRLALDALSFPRA